MQKVVQAAFAVACFWGLLDTWVLGCSLNDSISGPLTSRQSAVIHRMIGWWVFDHGFSCFVWYVYVKLHQWMPFDCFQCWHSCVYAALGETVVSIGNNNPAMWSCNHKEGDTRLIVHILHTLEQVLKRIEVCTIDTDVIVIFVGAFVKLQVFHKLTNYSTTSAFRGKGKIIMVSLIGSTHQSIWYTWLIS